MIGTLFRWYFPFSLEALCLPGHAYQAFERLAFTGQDGIMRTG
jgi:hypothetical protein